MAEEFYDQIEKIRAITLATNELNKLLEDIAMDPDVEVNVTAVKHITKGKAASRVRVTFGWGLKEASRG